MPNTAAKPSFAKRTGAPVLLDGARKSPATWQRIDLSRSTSTYQKVSVADLVDCNYCGRVKAGHFRLLTDRTVAPKGELSQLIGSNWDLAPIQ